MTKTMTLDQVLDLGPCWDHDTVTALFERHAPADGRITAQNVLDFHEANPDKLPLLDAVWLASQFVTNLAAVALTYHPAVEENPGNYVSAWRKANRMEPENQVYPLLYRLHKAGAPVLDLLRGALKPVKLTIEVTQDDIDKGTAKNCGSCPIALAARRHPVLLSFMNQDPDDRLVEVTFMQLNLIDKALSRLCGGHLPDPAWRFIADYDNGRTVAPFSFEVELS